jgi:hypothetical protein
MAQYSEWPSQPGCADIAEGVRLRGVAGGTRLVLILGLPAAWRPGMPPGPAATRGAP